MQSQHAAAVKLAAAVKYGELKQENFVQHQGMKRQVLITELKNEAEADASGSKQYTSLSG